MQEWMIAMFIVSILLILRDMAKTVFSDMRKSAATVIYEEHPQKERMRRYAAAFQKLADFLIEKTISAMESWKT